MAKDKFVVKGLPPSGLFKKKPRVTDNTDALGNAIYKSRAKRKPPKFGKGYQFGRK